ncbi:MAG TPA: hypothetical protein VMF12_00390 [Xanthobacteraceae bacterium]|nr:hypothetical protein [Xanthobacteraceae bacterium]
MAGHIQPKHWSVRAAIAAPFALALLVAGCSGGGNFFGGPTASTPAPAATPAPAPASSSGSWLPDDVANFFAGSSDKAPQPVAGASPDVECPYIQIREGASTLVVNGPGDNAAMSLKYQGTFERAARQCAVVAGQMVMKVGVEGRIILGPLGGPGQINVPLRIAVVDEKPSSSKTIVTKLILIPVTIASMDDNPSFTHVEDNLSFPLPSSEELENYIVYIGFDPLAVEAPAKHEKRTPRHRPKPRPAPTG